MFMNLKVGQRLALGFGVVLLLLAMIATVGVVQMAAIHADMKAITDEAFARVQSFSADWHADNFAGATVRRLSRAMWGYDVVTDAALIWFGPAGVVLVGLCVMMALRWPIVGLFAFLVMGLYIVSNVVLTSVYARPSNLKSVALDSRIGGALADAIASNASDTLPAAVRHGSSALA